MTKLEDLEKRLTIVESRLNCMDEPATEAPERDPYLVPGVPCEVWNDGDSPRWLYYFSAFDSVGMPNFKGSMVDSYSMYFDHYRVLGTVWDHAPEWAEWVATDADGEVRAHKKEPTITDKYEKDFWGSGDTALIVSIADPSDWKASLRRRPAWARGNK